MTLATTQAEPETGAKDRLLTAALTLFNEKGYAASSVREIVEAAGVTKPVLYYYFGSKEGIYLELMESSYQMFQAIVARTISISGTAEERITQFCTELFDISLQKLPMVRLMNGIHYGPPQGTPKFDLEIFSVAMTEVLYKLVQEGIESGELKTSQVEDAVRTVMAIVTTAINEQLCSRDNKPDRDTLVRMLRLLMSGMAQ
ncbi:TetR/AcrR family transcriptional regulator [Geomonas sp. Red32]|uniref:TetR/AcrR family transcriptional regulator n=1 Tax=Geomonas sp. Red32 TaxID=2912856 RepID=UPI00202CDC78|nr:TetR/AcrR family transcriptional regulator [Geomonas sp. Red32]MCM0081321.1 TetR/AcrR family transcriptional regulator [Geomonas sp. Red32]